MFCRENVWVVLLICLFTPSISSAADSDACDAVLVTQSTRLKENNNAFLSWLQIIDEETYNKAKTDASANGLTAYGMFEGDYNSFSEKRRKYLSLNNYVQSRSNSREEFKSYLTSEQIAAWANCKRSNLELVLYYKDVDPQGATLVLDWTPPRAVPELSSITTEFVVGKPSAALTNLHTLNGMHDFPIRRQTNGSAIRGSISGKANGIDFSASVYIPKFDTTETTIPPKRIVVSQAGQVRESIAYWAQGRFHAEWTCLKVPENMDLVVVEEYQNNLGIHRGACVPGPPFCDSYHEGCTDIVIKRGCFVNSDYHEWYKANSAKLGVPYSKAAVCGE